MTTKSALQQVVVCASALLVLAAPGTAFAQAKPAAQRPIGGYLNAHFGVAWPSEGTFVSSGSDNFGSQINEAKATYPIGSVIATATSDSQTLFQIAGMTPDAVVTVRHVPSVSRSRCTSPDQKRESETKINARIGITVESRP